MRTFKGPPYLPGRFLLSQGSHKSRPTSMGFSDRVVRLTSSKAESMAILTATCPWGEVRMTRDSLGLDFIASFLKIIQTAGMTANNTPRHRSDHLGSSMVKMAFRAIIAIFIAIH